MRSKSWLDLRSVAGIALASGIVAFSAAAYAQAQPTAPATPPGPGMMGPGMMQPGQGMMQPGQGMMQPGQGMGPGMMGPGMMQPGMMGPGMMQPGQGMMQPGMLQQGMGPGQGMRAAIVDRNGDGLISADEAAAWHEELFAAMDADDDEVVTLDEFIAVRAKSTTAPGPQADAQRQRQSAHYKAMDKSGDGKLTASEFLDFGAARFKQSDRDGDGKVSVWEFRAHRRW
jgi:hypothetical protein